MTPIDGLPEPGLLVSSEEVVAGRIDTSGAGSILSGSGFTITRNGVGNITITFTRPFSSVPNVVGMPELPSSNACHITGGTLGVSVNSVNLAAILSTTGAAMDSKLSFVAYIPSAAKTQVPRDFGLVTALPTSPTPQTGDLCTFTDSLTAPTYAWRLMYDAGQTAANRWLVIGGSPQETEVVTNEASSSLTFTNLATIGPSVTVPLAGDYLISQGVMTYTPGNNGIMSFSIGAAAATDTEAFWGGANAWQSVTRTQRKTGLAAATPLVSKYRVDAGTGNWQKRWMSVMPVRVG